MTTVPLPVYRLRAAQRGSALIMVIFLITMLGMIVYAMFNIVKHDADLANAQKQAFRARQVAEMGINWAMNPAIKPYDKEFLNQTLEDGAMFTTKIRGEGGRMNLNSILQQGESGRTFMTALFRLWGIEDNQQADDLFNNLLDWIDTDSAQHHNGMEKEQYQAQYGETTPYPFNRPFYDLDEIALVPGFEAITANVPDWRDFFTIYSAGKVDLNAAEAKVLAAVSTAIRNPGDPRGHYDRLLEPEEGAHAVLKLRWGEDGYEDTKDDKQLGNEDMAEITTFLDLPMPDPNGSTDPQAQMVNMIFGFNDQTTHIECTATVGDYRKRVVLVVRGRTGQPQILSREEMPLFE